MLPRDFTPIQLIFPGESACYQIPAFQRNYQWGIDQLHGLVRDIKRATFDQPHWIGVALIAAASEKCETASTEAGHRCFDVLDGQQRLLTTRIWCVALIDEYFRQTNKTLAMYSRERFTKVKVHALDTDDWAVLSDYRKIVNINPEEHSNRKIYQAYMYFRQILLNGIDGLISEEELEISKRPSVKVPEGQIPPTWLVWLEEFLSSGDCPKQPLSPSEIESLIKSSLEAIQLTTLEHESKDEAVEVIFETLNAKRTPLGQWDLFRNYILIKSQTHGSAQKDFYTNSLATAEKQIDSAKLGFRQNNLDRFLYDFLISQGVTSSGGTIRSDSTALEFRKYWEKFGHGIDVKSYIDDTLVPSMQAWLAAITGSEKMLLKDEVTNLDKEVWRTLRRIENISRGPFAPLTSRIIHEAALHVPFNQKELLKQLRLVESFAARTLLAGEAMSPLRSKIMSACQEIFGTSSVSLSDWVVQNAPNDDRVTRVLTQGLPRLVGGKLVESKIEDWSVKYEFAERAVNKQCRAIFDALVEHQEGQFGSVIVGVPGQKASSKEAISVEHLFPQSPGNWESDLAAWGVKLADMGNRLHSIGNIAVLPVKVNSQLSNSNLAEKKKLLREKQVPNWKTNKKFMDESKWGTAEIDSRTKELTKELLKFYKLP
jgi:hypothetical protein